MKKLLMVIFLGVFFICASSAYAAQDSKQDASMTSGSMVVEKSAAAFADATLTERLARGYEEAGKIEDAKKAWKEIFAKVKDVPMLYGQYAEFLNRTGDAKGAIEQLKKAQQFDPPNPFYTFRMAEILATNNKLDEAKAILNKLINETNNSLIKDDAEKRLEALDSLASKPLPSSDLSTTVSAPAMSIQQKEVAPK